MITQASDTDDQGLCGMSIAYFDSTIQRDNHVPLFTACRTCPV